MLASLSSKTRPWPGRCNGFHSIGGASRDRTGDLYNAIVALSQLSYGPTRWKAGKSIRPPRPASSRTGTGIAGGRVDRQVDPQQPSRRVLFEPPADLRREPADQCPAEAAIAIAPH